MSLQYDKRQVAKHFSKASSSYDSYAHFQRAIADDLLEIAASKPSPLTGPVIDLGCGTGYLAKQISIEPSRLVLADISESMLLKARAELGGDVDALCCDAENLPFSDNTVANIYSSLAIQWCNSLAKTLSEAHRVLKPGGSLYFSTLLDGSLHELKESWQQVDGSKHVNQFASLAAHQTAVDDIGCEHWLSVHTYQLAYSSVFPLLKELKGIGANYVADGKAGLTTARHLEQVDRYYHQHYPSPQGISASYQVLFGVLTKS